MMKWYYGPAEKILQWDESSSQWDEPSSSSTCNRVNGSFFPGGLFNFLAITATVLLIHAAATGYIDRVDHFLAPFLFPLAYTIAAIVTVKIKKNLKVTTESTGLFSQDNQIKRSVTFGLLLIPTLVASASLMFPGGNLYKGQTSPMLLVVFIFVPALGSIAYLTDNEDPIPLFVIACWIHACIFLGIPRDENLPALIAFLVAAGCCTFQMLWRIIERGDGIRIPTLKSLNLTLSPRLIRTVFSIVYLVVLITFLILVPQISASPTPIFYFAIVLLVVVFMEALKNKLDDPSLSWFGVETFKEIIMKGTPPVETEEYPSSHYPHLEISQEITMTENIGTLPEEIEEREISHEADLGESTGIELEKEGYMWECLLYCTLFPTNFQFIRDTLIWSWIAAGLIDSESSDEREAVAMRCFDGLIGSKYILLSGYDVMRDQTKYKLGNENLSILGEQASKHTYRKVSDGDRNMAEVEHLSLMFEHIDQIQFESILKCTRLRTLVLHKCWGSEFQNLLHDLFLEMRFLTNLDLSGTNIEELPSSIENLKALRLLDVSETPIKQLPESVNSLGCLETLILVRCLSLYGLPKCMNKLVSLQHLILDLALLLQAMPVGLGKLTNLQTLGAFVVGTKDGKRLGELRNINKLKGSLCLMKLENIGSAGEARKARLCDKQYLSKLELIWSGLQDAKVIMEQEILECLQPHFGLQELDIVSYSGGVLPSWISDPSFTQIASITLYGCRYCERLPSLGMLPSLKSLKIVDMDELVSIDKLFCQKETNQDQHSFPKLERLSLEGMPNLKTWTGVQEGHFPCLEQLLINYCPKLAALPTLSYLISLKHLEICYCPMLSCLPEEGLPASLKCLILKGCPKLREQCCNEQGVDWAKVASVPNLYIDHQKM